MEKAMIFGTEKYLYCYNRELKLFYLMHPLILFYKDNQFQCFDYKRIIELNENLTVHYSEKALEYYFRKYMYFRKLGILQEDKELAVPSGRVDTQLVEYGLANITQVVFEVTDRCNLKCKYCAYGELYGGYDPRDGVDLTFEKARMLLDYMIDKWKTQKHWATKREISLSFYGGEPLLNFKLIRQIIEYAETFEIPNARFVYNMTTNGMLLDKYMDFIVAHDFRLLLSLDGDDECDGYRLKYNSLPSFDTVYRNVKLLQKKYPTYFDKFVNFNAVIHRKNSVDRVYSFFEKEFNKTPRIAELTTLGVKEEVKKEFLATYQNLEDSVQEVKDYVTIEDKFFTFLPNVQLLTKFLHVYLGNVYKHYRGFSVDYTKLNYIPTGTCMPFERKMFMTATGNILPCENVPHLFKFYGHVDKEVYIDTEKIATGINRFYDSLEQSCSLCYNRQNCSQCIYHVAGIGEHPRCESFMTKNEKIREFAVKWGMLEKRPELYAKIFNKIVVY